MAGPITKLREAWTAGGVKELEAGHPDPPGRGWWYIPQASVDTRGVRDGLGNSAVTACLRVKGQGLSEAPIRVYDRVEGQDEEIPGHPLEQLLAQPNPLMVGELLWGYTVTACDATGDAYWAKVRSAAGRVVQLWPLIPSYVTPEDENGRLAQAGDEGKLIAYYEYSPNGKPTRIEPSEIIHLRTGLDPDNHRRGVAPLKTVLREVVGDEEAGQFAAALVSNMGIPGVALIPDEPGDPGPSPEDAEAMADVFQSKFSGRNRGRPWIPSARMKPHIISFTPEQMDFKTVRRVPEERISAVLGVPAILAQLGAGLDRAINANARELREFFTESTLSPLWRIFGAQLTVQLLPDFDPATSRRAGFDTSEVRALAQDEDAIWKRVDAGVKGGWATVADARRAAGLDTDPTHDVFLRALNQVEVPADQPRSPNGETAPTAEELEEMIG